MLDLVVFTQYPLSYAPTRLLEAAKKIGLKTKLVGYDKIRVIKSLSNAKYVILREPNAKDNLYNLRDDILKHYLNRKSVILNSQSYLKWPVLDKLTQHSEFKKAGITCIKPLKLEDTTYPYIVKSKLGSHGSHVFKIEKNDDLEKVLEKYHRNDLLVQEFQTAGYDLRVIVLGQKVLGIMKRVPKKGEFLSNYSQGGSIEKYIDLKGEVGKIARKTAKHFKLDFVGVDLIKGNDGKWKVLEVNRACQFKGFEKATGKNVAFKIIDFMVKK